MPAFRLSIFLLPAPILLMAISGSATAEDDLLAERGRRICEEAGIPLADCMMLPPDDHEESLASVPETPNVIPAGFKGETLVDRGRRMCEEEGVALADCRMLPLEYRGATRSVVIEPLPAPPADPNGFGWCPNCESLFGDGDVVPWTRFAGRQFTPNRDEDDDNRSATDPAGGNDNDDSGSGDDGEEPGGSGNDDGADSDDNDTDGDNGSGGDGNGGDGDGNDGNNGDAGGYDGGENCP